MMIMIILDQIKMVKMIKLIKMFKLTKRSKIIKRNKMFKMIQMINSKMYRLLCKKHLAPVEGFAPQFKICLAFDSFGVRLILQILLRNKTNVVNRKLNIFSITIAMAFDILSSQCFHAVLLEQICINLAALQITN